MIKELKSKIFSDKIKLSYRPKLYLSEDLTERDLPKIKRKISKGRGSCKLILIADKENENFDIVGPSQLKLKVWEGKKPVVAGIASGEAQAFELIMKIIDDCMAKRGDLMLKEYIWSL